MRCARGSPEPPTVREVGFELNERWLARPTASLERDFSEVSYGCRAAVTQFHPYPGTPPARAKPCWWPCTAGRARRFAGACADLRERRGNFAVAMTQEGPRVEGLPVSRQEHLLPTYKDDYAPRLDRATRWANVGMGL